MMKSGTLNNCGNMQILNFIKSLYFNFRYLPFRQAVYMPVWITTNFRIHGLKRGQLILHQPYRKSVFLGDCGSPGLQEMKGCIYMSKDSKLIFQGFTVISQGSVLRVDNNSTIVLGNDFYCNKNCFLRSSSLIKFGKNCSLGWNVQINNNDGHEITHDGHVSPQIGDVIIGDYVWLTSNTIINKNISIADGCIIAQGAVVVKSIEQPKSLAGGIPAKIIQSNINWKK